MTEALHAFLRSRRSIRRFKPGPVPQAVLERIIETACYAPSAHNSQPWRFAVLTDMAAKVRLAEAITGKFRADMLADHTKEKDIQARVDRTIRRTKEAPVIVVLCKDLARTEQKPGTQLENGEQTMAVQSVALAGLQLLLAAHAESLGGTWICWPLFAPQETCRALNLPEEWEPQGMFFLGYPAEQPEVQPRLPVSEIMKYIHL
jgi:coenzyme F420-0:L-glutamate ligase/coenzyme F420-1:gamma-L-glutamate ligase